MFEQALARIADAAGVWHFLRWTLLPTFARWWLQHRTGAVMVPSLKFYPDRDTLNRIGNYGKFLGSAQQIYAIYVTGRKLRQHEIENVSHIREVILPNPQSESFCTFAESLGELLDQQRQVCLTTKYLKNKGGINVLWYTEMIYASIIIGDPEKPTGWVQVEHVLPYSAANKRPSFTIYKAKYSDVVNHYWSVYKDIRANSAEPDLSFVDKTLARES